MGETGQETDEVVEMATGEYLRRKMATAGLNCQTLAPKLKVHPQTLYNVTGDPASRRPISAGLALKLSFFFVEPVEFWLSGTVRLTPAQLAELALTPKEANGDDRPSLGTNSLPVVEKQSASSHERTLIDQEIAALLAESENVKIIPFNADNVQPASYDLTAGLIITKGFSELSQHEWQLVLKHQFPDDGETLSEHDREYVDRIMKIKSDKIEFREPEVPLCKSDSAVVLMRETVSFGKDYLADVGGMAANAMRGLLVSYGLQVDPGYSGPMFVTVMNIGAEPYKLSRGHKLVSLAIRQLAKSPVKAYREDVANRVSKVLTRVEGVLKDCFTCKKIAGGGGFFAQSDLLDKPIVGASKEEALDHAVAAVLRRLTVTMNGDPEVATFAQKIDDVLNVVLIDASEAEALVDHLAGGDEAKKQAILQKFEDAEDKRWLTEILKMLGVGLATAFLDREVNDGNV